MDYLVLFLLAGGIAGCLAECMYGMNNYKVGESWTAVDGCNKCKCTRHGMQCTFNPCQNSGFAQPNQGADCNYEGAWYRLHDQWLTKDGCNTCVCQMPDAE